MTVDAKFQYYLLPCRQTGILTVLVQAKISILFTNNLFCLQYS